MFVLDLNNSNNILLSRSLFQRKARGSDDHWIKTKLSENAVDQSVEVGDVSVDGKWKAILSVSGWILVFILVCGDAAYHFVVVTLSDGKVTTE